MNFATKTVIAACFLSFPGISIAQEASESEAPVTETETPAEPSIADQLSTGTPTDPSGWQPLPTREEVVVGEEYIFDVSGDWQIRCAKSEADNDPCQMYQLIENDDGPFAEISIFPINEADSKAVAGATIITPLDTMLPPGILISVDEQNGRRYPYAFCSTVGCVGRIGLLPEDITNYKRGSVASLQIIPAIAPDRTATATISLKGFTLGFEKLQALAPAQ